MNPMHSVNIQTKYGEKTISVYSCNILDFPEQTDILTVSAFVGGYAPTPGTMFEALDLVGIDVEALADAPKIDLRDTCNLWLSQEIKSSPLPVGHIACVEMSHECDTEPCNREKEILALIKAYFKFLGLISLSGIKVESVVMPLIGAGCQGISPEITIIPIINECIEFLKTNENIKKFNFVDYNQSNAFKIAMALENSYTLHKEKLSYSGHPHDSADLVFISYTTTDKSIADSICAKLEASGKRVWYAPRNVNENDYATSIVKAIERCSHFIVIISHNSMQSEHVLNEVDLAFKELYRGIRYHPLRMDGEELRPAFLYYLSRQHWIDAHIPPREKRIEEFVDKIVSGEF